MPRQVREAPRRREPAARRTVFSQPWPLPISPVVLGLLAMFALAAGLAWFFEGRYETPPAEAAKLVTPYKADDVKQVVLTSPQGTATYTRDEASGKFVAPGPQPTPSPTPAPESTPGPVELSPATKLESLLNQLHDLRIDRVIEEQPSASADYGLDAPQLTLQIVPKRGATAAIAIGKLNPNKTSYYLRREDRKDTVLVPRYTLDDLIKVANDLIKPS
jgi:hypothetical protein